VQASKTQPNLRAAQLSPRWITIREARRSASAKRLSGIEIDVFIRKVVGEGVNPRYTGVWHTTSML
jgi:hypothetical protein